MSDAITDEGVIWIGVSAQALGITGGRVSSRPDRPTRTRPTRAIRATNPERYAGLEHPGDAFAYDIYSQVAAALRSPEGSAVLGGVPLEHLLAIGESQSAGWLTSYVNGFQPETDLFDGFFVHSRMAGPAGLDVAGPVYASEVATRFRTDLDVPVMVIETETDVGSGAATPSPASRRPSCSGCGRWPAPRTPTASWSAGLDLGCGLINSGPQHWIAKAAFAALMRWVETGDPPACASRLETDGPGSTTFRRDAHGNTIGGVRTPAVDVPVSSCAARPHRAPRRSARCSGRRPRSTTRPSARSTPAPRSTSSGSRSRST